MRESPNLGLHLTTDEDRALNVAEWVDSQTGEGDSNMMKLDAAIGGHLADTGNPHGVSAEQVGAIPDSEKGSPGGVAELDSTGKVPEEQIPELSFVYECTGNADSTAIANIVNDFFNNGTAMSMKLIVTGTMGVAFTSTYYAMYISGSNDRGATCFMDFSDCNIPEITSSPRDFLSVSSSSEASLDITGLAVSTTRYGIYLANGINSNFSNCKITGGTYCVNLASSNNSFNNCTITCSGSSGSGVYMSSSTGNSFSDCTIAGSSSASSLGYGVYMSSSSNNSFSNCTISDSGIGGTGVSMSSSSNNNSFSNCKITGSNSSGYGVDTGSSSSNNSFSNCTISGGSGMYISSSNNSFSNCTIAGSNSSGRGVNIRSSNTSFSNCTISGGTYGVYTDAGYSGEACFVACKITGGTYGVYITMISAYVTAMAKLIGCAISGSGSDYDVYQVAETGTISWCIMGCSFAHTQIYVNGAARTAGTTYENMYLYMPVYANFFSRTID